MFHQKYYRITYSIVFKVSRKKIAINSVIWSISFFALFTFICWFGYQNWFREVFLQGEYTEYNMVKETLYAYPFYGDSVWFTIYQRMSIYVTTFATSVFILTVLNRNRFYKNRRQLVFFLFAVAISYFTALIAVTAEGCVFDLDKTFRVYFGPTVAKYVILGPSQLSIISTFISFGFLYHVYRNLSDKIQGILEYARSD